MTEAVLKKIRTQRGHILMMLRNNKHISKSQFAKKSGLSRPTVDAIESGNRSYSINSYIIYKQELMRAI